MICPKCKKEISKEDKFCGYCGRELKTDNEVIDLKRLSDDTKSKRFSLENYRLRNINLDTAKKHIRNALIAGGIILGLQVLLLIFGVYEAVYWIDVFILVILLFGLYKKNTPCVIILFLYFLISKIVQLSEGEMNIVAIFLGIIFLNYFYLGALGVIKHNRLVKKKKSTVKSLIIGILIGIIVAVFLGYLIFQAFMSYPEEEITAEDILYAADYQEGYKAGYADGRAYYGEIGDNYLPPATKERKLVYTQGYLEGFFIGCDEGGFDCSEIEDTINEFYSAGGNKGEIELTPFIEN